VPYRLISSFGLPVALTTGRLVISTAAALSRRPVGRVAALALPVILLSAHLVRAGWRRRLVSRRASPS
jgi:hypothetical protein